MRHSAAQTCVFGICQHTNGGSSMEVRGVGRAMFAAILLMIAGTLNIIYGIGALDDANVHTVDSRVEYEALVRVTFASSR